MPRDSTNLQRLKLIPFSGANTFRRKMAITLSKIVPITRTCLSPANNSPPSTTASGYSYNLTLSPSVTANKTILASSSLSRRPVSAAVSSSTGTASIGIGEETGSLLERVEVFDLKGNSILISDLWKDRKAVVAFARHFGCVLCRKRADMLAAKKDAMDASGVALVLIGPGSVDQARAFSEQTGFKGEVYADPSYASYKALSFVSGVTTTFTPGSALKIIEAYMEGYRQDWELSFQKDTRTKGGWQQGGIIVAGPGISNISYIHRDKEAGDDPNVQDILKACCSS